MNKLRFGAALGVALLVAAIGPAHAVLEEVIVKAQKREQSIRDVGLTLSAFNEEAFRELGLDNIARLADQIPGAIAFGTGTTIQSIFIRGIGQNEFAGNFDTPTAVHVDEVYVSKNWMIARPLFDVQRVEVLKGPQGTLFGRNTTGGAVNYYTNNPTDSFAAGADFSIDNHERYNVEGFVSGPLGGDFKGRVAFRWADSGGGPWENVTIGDDQGGEDAFFVRGKLLWDAENTDVMLTINGGRDESELTPYKSPGIYSLGGAYCPELFTGQVISKPSSCLKYGGAAAAAGMPAIEVELDDPFVYTAELINSRDDTLYGVTLRIDHDMGWATLTSITAYQYHETINNEDSDDSPIRSTLVNYYDEIDQFTQEIRLTGELTESWRYIIGGFFESDSLIETNTASLEANPLGLLPPFAPRLAADLEQDVESSAFFIHNEFDFTDTVTIIGGVRYSFESTEVDARTFLGANDRMGDRGLITAVIPVDQLRDSRSDKDGSFRLGAQWQPVDNWLVYGNFTTGYRTGGYSVPFGGAIREFDREKMFAKEFGIKTQLFDQTVQMNAAGFHYLYDQLQVNVDDPASPLVPFTTNIGKSDTKGVEADIWWVPTEQWDVRFGFSYLDAEFSRTDAAIADYTFSLTGMQTPLQGLRPINTPEWTFNGLVRYQRPVFGGWNMTLSTNFRWVDERFLEVTNRPFDRADDYYIVNARGSLRSPDGRWEIAAWGNNITDEEYINYINNITFFRLDIYGEPASYGLTLSYRYE